MRIEDDVKERVEAFLDDYLDLVRKHGLWLTTPHGAIMVQRYDDPNDSQLELELDLIRGNTPLERL